MAMQTISASVGSGAVNRVDDVTMVQKLLIARGYSTGGSTNGNCDDATVRAIRNFQSDFMRNPDGRIDVNGNSWRLLSAVFTGVSDSAMPVDAHPLIRSVPRPSADKINIDLRSVSNTFMLETFGEPLVASNYTTQCQPLTNDRLRRNIVTESVGPFRVTGLRPAVMSLREVMSEIAREQPTVYAELGSAGMLCCRLVRRSKSSISNHSWGTAIDLTISGVLDTYGNDKVQFGLTLIAPIFNRMGWYWGAAFRTEDGMHFEGSRTLVTQWAEQLT